MVIDGVYKITDPAGSVAIVEFIACRDNYNKIFRLVRLLKYKGFLHAPIEGEAFALSFGAEPKTKIETLTKVENILYAKEKFKKE